MESINILNVHAGKKADQRPGELIDPRFSNLFSNFIHAWTQSNFSSDYLGQDVMGSEEAAVNKAYWEIQKFLQSELERKREARKKEEARKIAAGEGRA